MRTPWIHRPSDLIQVPPDRAELADGTFQSDELVFGQRRYSSQMRPHEHRYVGGACHATRRGPLTQE
jgi:hypothetical protein